MAVGRLATTCANTAAPVEDRTTSLANDYKQTTKNNNYQLIICMFLFFVLADRRFIGNKNVNRGGLWDKLENETESEKMSMSTIHK